MQETQLANHVRSTNSTVKPTCEACGNLAAIIADLDDPQICEAVALLLYVGAITAIEGGDPPVRVYSFDKQLTVQQVEKKLNFAETWVRRHRCELGGFQIGGCGRGADLRFPAQKVEAYLSPCARKARQ